MKINFIGKQSIFGTTVYIYKERNVYSLIKTNKRFLQNFESNHAKIVVYGYIDYFLFSKLFSELWDQNDSLLKYEINVRKEPYYYAEMVIDHIYNFESKGIPSIYSKFNIEVSIENINLFLSYAGRTEKIRLKYGANLKYYNTPEKLFKHYDFVRRNYLEILDVYNIVQIGCPNIQNDLNQLALCLLDYKSVDKHILKEYVRIISNSDWHQIFTTIIVCTKVELSEHFNNEINNNDLPDLSGLNEPIVLLKFKTKSIDIEDSKFKQTVKYLDIFANQDKIKSELLNAQNLF